MEGVELVGTHDEVGQGVDAQGGVVGPVHGAHLQRQRTQVGLADDRLRKLHVK